MSITFSSCFYIIKSKFNPQTYIQWMNNFISIVNNFNLVIYTDQNSIKYIKNNPSIKENPRIKIIIKPLENFYNYKYKAFWIKNHEKNVLLNDKSSWKLNMLWNEKIWFVNETIVNKYFKTDFYGWCDIGYFRNRQNDTHTRSLSNWGNQSKVLELNSETIYYACVTNDNTYLKMLNRIITNKNAKGLPIIPIPPKQNSFAGGFFILHKDKINWWCKTYYNKLHLYLINNYLVKDDQIILLDCILSNFNEFSLIRENSNEYDNWFLFQRYLL